MSDDIRKYRTLLETAHNQTMEMTHDNTMEMTNSAPMGMSATSNRLEQDASDAAQLLVDVLHASGKEANMHHMVKQALKAYHGENAAHHDWRKFGAAVMRHADQIIQQRKAA
jgi:hypothetical protein